MEINLIISQASNFNFLAYYVKFQQKKVTIIVPNKDFRKKMFLLDEFLRQVIFILKN